MEESYNSCKAAFSAERNYYLRMF